MHVTAMHAVEVAQCHDGPAQCRGSLVMYDGERPLLQIHHGWMIADSE
jgi:hypothetical protein